MCSLLQRVWFAKEKTDADLAGKNDFFLSGELGAVFYDICYVPELLFYLFIIILTLSFDIRFEILKFMSTENDDKRTGNSF